MQDLKLLVVDDDDLVIQAIKMASPEQWYVSGINSAKELPPLKGFFAAFVDVHLTPDKSDLSGIRLMEQLRKHNPHLEIVAISGDLNRQNMESCLKAGATRFLAKPLSRDEIQLTLQKIEALFLLQGAINRPGREVIDWIGSSQRSQDIKRQIAQLKGENGPILIEGESGTGKEVAAQLLHAQENRPPLIAINVAGLSENLFESELFGHIKGAFTGAEQNKMGLIEAANGGDLFLDEVEALSLSQQVKLLRFLETQQIRRVGSNETLQVQTRVIVATNQNLEKLVKEGKFREDLLWRLNGKKLLLPPLRERLEDISDLVNYFVKKDRRRIHEFSEEALNTLKNYPWPGNVRELKRVIEQVMLSAPLPVIRREDIIQVIQPRSAVNTSTTGADFSEGLSTLVNRYESQIITHCLEQLTDIDLVARTLKISGSNLYKKIKDHQIQWKD